MRTKINFTSSFTKTLKDQNAILFFNQSCYIPLYNHTIDISSTNIRNKLQQNIGITILVPNKVEKYIYDNKLYQNK